MDFINTLEENSILIIPNNIKDKVLDYIDKNELLIDIKLMTFNELLQGLFYSYTSEAIYDVMKEDHFTYESAKDFIDYTYYIKDEESDNIKIKKLLRIKNRLDSKGLLIRDSLFADLLKSKNKLYVYGFTTINKLNIYLLDLAKFYIEVQVIDKEDKSYKHKAHQFKTLENEVIYVAEKISTLINQGVPVNKIYLANYSDEYYFSIHKIFGLYGIPVYLKGQTKLSDTTIAKYFIDNLSNDMNKLLDDIKKKYDIDNNAYNNKVYNKIFNLINTYYWTNDYVSIKDVIIAEMKHLNINQDHLENEIKTIDITDNIFDDDEYIFLLGLNQKSIPRTYHDEDYIDDSIPLDTKETSLEQNIGSKVRYTRAIKNIKPENLTITLKEISLKEKYLPSTLIDDDNIILVEEDVSYSSYSDRFNELLYANRLDDLIKFNDMHDDIKDLHVSYDIPYNTYKNNYTKVDGEKLKNRITEKGFSYSSISTYFECPFRFYLNYFFKLSEFETTFDTLIGTAFHKVLEEYVKDQSINIYQTYYDAIEEEKNNKHVILGAKENYFIEKVKTELLYITENIMNQLDYASEDITDIWTEKKLIFNTDELDLNTKIKTFITGVVDKCLFIGDDVIIVDYKTGTTASIKRDYFEYGITIQLPIYLYLLKNNKEGKNYNIVGMYLQHILDGLVYRKDNKTYEEVKIDRLKLDGLTLDNMSKVYKFDNSCDSSKIIRGLKKTKEGEWQYQSRIMTSDDQDKLYEIIKNLWTEGINNTVDAKFDIKPIKDRKVNGCDYCTYQDICFRREENFNKINGYEENQDEEEGEEDERS